MIKRILTLIFLLFLFSFQVSAESTSADEFYYNQYKSSGADELEGYLPEETREYFKDNNIDPLKSGWTDSLEPKNVFTHILSFLKSGAKGPFASGSVIIAMILVSSALNGMDIKGASSVATGYAVSLTAAASVITPIFSVISAGANALKGCAAFMVAFVPVFAVIVASSGATATSASMSGLLLGACQAVNLIADFVIMPLMGGYLAISIASNVSPLVENSGLASGIKKICYWVMSLLTTVFLGILSIQTAVNASADTLSLKTAKFIIGSSVPMAGTALSEALTTVTASMGMLKTTVGIYGVIACAAVFLPILAELVLWRITFNITATISDLMSVPKISSVLRSADTVLSVLIGIILLTAAMFIISLGVVLAAGGTK
jgi:stage III sporulation protein AE